MKDLFVKEYIVFLCFGIIFSALYYNFYLAPRDKALYAVIDCMQDLHSKTEYDMCDRQLKESK